MCIPTYFARIYDWSITLISRHQRYNYGFGCKLNMQRISSSPVELGSIILESEHTIIIWPHSQVNLGACYQAHRKMRWKWIPTLHLIYAEAQGLMHFLKSLKEQGLWQVMVGQGLGLSSWQAKGVQMRAAKTPLPRAGNAKIRLSLHSNCCLVFIHWCMQTLYFYNGLALKGNLPLLVTSRHLCLLLNKPHLLPGWEEQENLIDLPKHAACQPYLWPRSIRSCLSQTIWQCSPTLSNDW